MNNFIFQNSTKVYFGKGCVKEYLTCLTKNAQTILLAAVEMGLGGCMIGNFQAGEGMEVLGLPEEIRPLLIVAFGKPAEEIHLVDVPEDGNTNYYRDENDVHYVPKRTLADELLN